MVIAIIRGTLKCDLWRIFRKGACCVVLLSDEMLQMEVFNSAITDAESI